VVAPLGAGGGGAAALGAGSGSAAGLRDMLGGVTAAARRLANFATYYQMKSRAGTVGTAGLAPVLQQIRQKHGGVRIHLVGHSFGGRVVTAAAAVLEKGSPNVTMTLLQAAYSHNGLAENYEPNKNGVFRTLLADRRVSGPIVITHTKNDTAVGIAYPLASRVAREKAAAFGDENDPYGGMGRNGAQHTPEARGHAQELRQVGHEYAFEPGRVYNLKADAFIKDHSDVTGPQVAAAFLAAVRAI
jgi:pimeloyl-ACP methyl ester carboxylesterase